MIEKNREFSQIELSDWVADNCSFFEFDRNTPKRYKRHKVSTEIEPLLGAPIELGLITQTESGRETNGIHGYDILQYTTSGQLLALIIDSFNQDRRLADNHKIYEILQSYYSSNKSSKHQFFLRLLTAYHQQDRLDDMTEIVRKVLDRVTSVPCDLMDLYEIVKITYFTDLEKAKVFLSNWKTAMDNLEPFTRNLLLHDIKLEYEARMMNHKDLGDAVLYEDYRFELMGHPESVALQGRCIKCSIVQNLSYSTSKVLIRNLSDRPLGIKCPNCGDNNCIVIPTL
jgi:hypothetical protein